MKILTKEDVRELLKGKTLDTLTAELFSHLQLVEGAYSRHLAWAYKIALSKFFAYLVLRDSPVCLYVTGWEWRRNTSICFIRYRRSFGDQRLLMEAPVHVFEPTEDEAFVSVLSMAFFYFCSFADAIIRSGSASLTSCTDSIAPLQEV